MNDINEHWILYRADFYFFIKKSDSAEITDELQEPERHNIKTGPDRQKRSSDLESQCGIY